MTGDRKTTEGIETRIGALADAITADRLVLAAAVERGAREQAHRLVDLIIEAQDRLEALKAEQFREM